MTWLQKKIGELSPSGRWIEYSDQEEQKKIWRRFFLKSFTKRQGGAVLDFGCGATWAEYVFKELYNDQKFVSLDIDDDEVKKVFGFYANYLGNDVHYYDGKILPFPNGEFSSIVFKASLMKVPENNLALITRQLIRVSTVGAEWYIAPRSMYFRYLDYLKFKPELRAELKKNKIKLIPWTWNIFELNNRSKKFVTEFYLGYFLTNLKRRFKNKI